jgi:hypothetical protein
LRYAELCRRNGGKAAAAESRERDGGGGRRRAGERGAAGDRVWARGWGGVLTRGWVGGRGCMKNIQGVLVKRQFPLLRVEMKFKSRAFIQMY